VRRKVRENPESSHDLLGCKYIHFDPPPGRGRDLRHIQEREFRGEPAACKAFDATGAFAECRRVYSKEATSRDNLQSVAKRAA